METTTTTAHRIASLLLGAGIFGTVARFLANSPVIATTAITSII
jgi:hypothetical protein